MILSLSRPVTLVFSTLILLNFYLFHRVLHQPVVTSTFSVNTTPVQQQQQQQQQQQDQQYQAFLSPSPTPIPEPTTATQPAWTTVPISAATSTSTPTPTPTAFPLKLWQKSGPKGVSPDIQTYIQSWHTLNPSLRHEILSDESALAYVEEIFREDWPEVADLYQKIQVPIIRADLLRLLILYADGGIWSDLDVTCEVPIAEWIPKELVTPDGRVVGKEQVNAVVGLEFDGWQFASWTLMAKPGLNHFERAIGYVMRQMEGIAHSNNVTIPGVTMEMIPDVVDASGPQAITVALLRSLSYSLGETVDRANITNLHEPRLLGDVLVLPQAAYAALQGGYPEDQGPYLVSHHYAGSWKNVQGGEQRR
ncbi:glycosyltransferase family 32 protein [Aspergillus saccharolyticus JOP 1030-1]|uniref:Initiation-specific alpha-1,6-mannosyltransferase n=1 Tax=Aspergillus saccharolyticus JOP 1030-1 TaxID=1450539 RepID=A0A318ZS09_9EURO|nr:hypothetical protein BP01DRAFT_352420 [Aspergillus saccharolyticus JOP 1030-1]PYH49877.1 hypothetical protein BP01DRAFT_352420 [Aspergillus saccharolyticus JOP 1030-1]